MNVSKLKTSMDSRTEHISWNFKTAWFLPWLSSGEQWKYRFPSLIKIYAEIIQKIN